MCLFVFVPIPFTRLQCHFMITFGKKTGSVHYSNGNGKNSHGNGEKLDLCKQRADGSM